MFTHFNNHLISLKNMMKRLVDGKGRLELEIPPLCFVGLFLFLADMSCFYDLNQKTSFLSLSDYY